MTGISCCLLFGCPLLFLNVIFADCACVVLWHLMLAVALWTTWPSWAIRWMKNNNIRLLTFFTAKSNLCWSSVMSYMFWIFHWVLELRIAKSRCKAPHYLWCWLWCWKWRQMYHGTEQWEGWISCGSLQAAGLQSTPSQPHIWQSRRWIHTRTYLQRASNQT